MSLQDDRKEYLNGELGDESLSANPREMFLAWLEEYRLLGNSDSTAFALSTVSKDGTPDSRIVLLKEIRDEGFVFYTNFNSKKGQELKVNQKASMCFHWKSLRRQVRILGKVEEVTTKEADDYYNSRPYKNRISAWASSQSQILEKREIFLNKIQEYEKKYSDEAMMEIDNLLKLFN